MKPLGIGPERQDRRMGRYSSVGQVQMDEQRLSRCVRFERKGTFSTGGIQEPHGPFPGEIVPE
jgi:hypothetical protein